MISVLRFERFRRIGRDQRDVQPAHLGEFQAIIHLMQIVCVNGAGQLRPEQYFGPVVDFCAARLTL